MNHIELSTKSHHYDRLYDDHQQRSHQPQQLHHQLNENPQHFGVVGTPYSNEYHPDHHINYSHLNNVNNNENYAPVPVVYSSVGTSKDTIFSSKNDPNGDKEFLLSLAIFIAGFFICCVWLGNIMFLKSKNKMARIFAILSIVLVVVFTVATIVLIIFAFATPIFMISQFN